MSYEVSCVRILEEVYSVITSLYANYVDNKQGAYVIILRIHLNIPVCNKRLSIRIIATLSINRADSWVATSDKETSLQSNTASNWLGANLESALISRDGFWDAGLWLVSNQVKGIRKLETSQSLNQSKSAKQGQKSLTSSHMILTYQGRARAFDEQLLAYF